MAAPYSEWPYATGDPNKSEAEKAGEASIAYKRYLDGEKAEDIAADLGISRTTFYRRLHDHALRHDQPTRQLRQLRAEAELDALRAHLLILLAGEASVADKATLLKELRMLNASWRKLYAVDDTPSVTDPPAPAADPEVQAWVSAVRAESELELRRARGTT